jgi:hypothetical protein
MRLRLGLAFLVMSGAPPVVVSQGRGGSASANVTPVVVLRRFGSVDTDLTVARRARLVVVVRQTEHPLEVIQQSTVALRVDDREVVRAVTSAAGMVRLDSLETREYQLRVYAVGYAPAIFDVKAIPGCQTDVEVYLGLQPIGIAPGPSGPRRATVTTCGKE